MAVDIGFIISAQNNATAELERVGRTFDDLGTRATKTTQTFSQTGRQVRLLAGEISTELNPALGSVVARATQATGAVGGMGVGMAGATVAIVAGAAALGAYLRNLNETAERQAILNVAVRSFDAGPMRQQLQAVSVEMEKQSVLSLGLIGRLEVMARKVTDAIGFTTAEISKRTDAQAALARVLPVEREQMLAEAYKDQANALQTLVATEIQRAERISSLEKVIELQQRLVQEINREADAEQRLIEIRRQIDAAAASSRGEPQSAIDIINERAARRKSTLGERTFAAQTQVLEATARARAEIFERGQQGAFGADFTAGLEGIGVGPTVDELQAGAVRRRQLEQEILALNQQRAQVLTQIVGLTDSERAAAELISIEAERRLKISEALGDAGKEEVANLQAQVAAFNVLKAEQDRLDAATGLAQGFRDAAEEAEESGRILGDTARNTARTMQRAFSDEFFAVITGDFKKLPDLGRAFALSMVRNFTDALGQMASAPILRSLGGMRGVVPFGTVGAGAAAAAAQGTTISTPAGQAILTSGGAVGGSSGVTSAGIFPGGGLGGATSLLDLFSAGGLTAGAAISGADVAALSAAGYSAADISGIAALSGTSSIATTAGITLGEALGAAGAVVGFGFSLYSAYQAGSPTQGAITGGISGLVAGATIGSIFPVIGTAVGAVVGLVAGAALGAGAGALGKKGPSHSAREAKEARKASESVGGAVGAISAANTFEELHRAILTYTASAYGGFKSASDERSAGFAVSFVHPDSSNRVVVGRGRNFAGPNDLRRLGQSGDLGTIKARIQAGIAEATIAQVGAPVEEALRQKIERLTAIETRAFFSFRQRFAAPGLAAGGGVGATYERETFLPLSRAGEAAGQNININREILAGAGMTDAEIAAFLRRLAQVDYDQSLGYFNVDRVIL